MKTAKLVLLTAVLTICWPAFAGQEEEETARQDAFRAGMQDIVDGLNAGSTDRLIAAINQAEFVERIFGLRLIDQRVKKSFRESMQNQFDGMVSATFSDGKEAIKATLLGVESVGNRGRAVVRFDLPDFQFNYHEYELQLDDSNNLILVDWLDFLRGEGFTEGVGMSLILASPSKPAIRKLLDFRDVRESDLFQLTELLKAARDRQAERYIEIINGLDERLARQRVVVLTSVQLTKQIRSRRMLRTALAYMAKYHPEEPLFALSLLDYYFPTRQYEQALQALQRLYARLDVDDAAMEARLSAAELVMGNADDADARADKALGLEPGLELAWWSALRARVARSDFPRSVEALQELEAQFGHKLDRDALGRDPGLAALLASDAYANWLATRK